MQDALLAVLLPLYGLLACGFLAGRSGVMEASHSGVLNKFVFSFSMPAFVFVSLSRVDAGKFFDWPFLGTLFSGMLIMLLAGFALAR